MRALLWLAVVLPALAFPAPGNGGALAAGDVVVAGTPAGETVEGLYRVDPTTAAHDLLAGGHFVDHAIDATGAVFAIEDDVVLEIDPVTGGETPVPGGSGLGTLAGIAVDGAGIVYLTSITPAGPVDGGSVRVLRLDPATGDVAPLASGGYLRGRNGFVYPLDLEIAADGAPLVLMSGVYYSLASVVRIDPADGSQALLTSDSDLLATSVGLGVAPDGSLLVTADGFAVCDCVALIDPLTGAITGGSLRILVDGVPQGTATASDIAVGLDDRIWLLAFVGAPVGSGLFRWDERPQLEVGGHAFLPMSSDPLGDVQVVRSICGDGQIGGSEECDDGNGSSGDGCSRLCRAEACGNGRLDAGEACDDGNTASGDGCDENCTPTACGNEVVTSGEECDDGNTLSGDGCDANCTFTGCGNGVVTAGEACDDGDDVADNGCDGSCRVDFGAQTKKQRQCVNAVNQGIGRLASARAKANERCLDAAVDGKLGGDPTAFDLCLDADAQGKVAQAARELEARERESCRTEAPPELALAADHLAGAPAAAALPSALVRDLFGEPAASPPKGDDASAACQRKLLKQANALFDSIWLELRDAKADKLAGRGSDPAVSDAELTAFVEQVAAGSRSIAKAADALRERTADACGAVAGLMSLFPGCEPASAAALGECAERSARCRACLLQVESDPGLALDCDLFDDRAGDGSCAVAG